jgi:hypothetical protein
MYTIVWRVHLFELNAEMNQDFATKIPTIKIIEMYAVTGSILLFCFVFRVKLF